MMTEIHSAAAVDDHRRGLFVRLSQDSSDGDVYGTQYLYGISSSQNQVNICFPFFDSLSYGGCCGGLLYLHHRRGETVIFNPITREFKFLPPSDVKRPLDTDYSIYDACGLGFDSQSNDYKVIRFVSNYYVETFNDVSGMPELTRFLDTQGEIYSLKNNCWKEISTPTPSLERSGIYVNTKCYWKARSPYRSVISFDFEKESFSSFIPMPNSLPLESDLEGFIDDDDLDIFDGLDIFEYRGYLAVIGYKKSRLYTLYEAYKLIEGEEEQYQWDKVFAVEVFGDVNRPLGFGKNGRLLFLEGNGVENEPYHQILEYDLIDRYLKKLPFFADQATRMQVLSCSDDDPNANIFSRVESTMVLPAAKQLFVVDDGMETKERVNRYPYRNFGSKSMTKIYSIAAAAAAVDDHRRLFVQLPLLNSAGYGYEYGYSNQYLCDISSSENKENIYFPSFGSDSYSGCCGGLLYLYHIEGEIVILNPIRREFKFLPPSDVHRPAHTGFSYYCACGLGFDSQSNDYKFIRFVSNHYDVTSDDGSSRYARSLDSLVEIYSLKNNSWKEILALEVSEELPEGCGIYVNTKCYWISYSSSSSGVISFDFEKESLSSFIPMPNTLPTGGLDIFDYMGSLAVIGYKNLGWFTRFEAYILKEQEQEWRKVFVVEVPGVQRPLGFGKNGRSLFLEGDYAENEGSQLVNFDLIDQRLEKLPIFADRGRCMQIISCSYDDPNANIFSRVESIVVLPGAKQFFVEKPGAKQFFVEEVMEIENPRNHHPYRKFGQQVQTEQREGFNKRRAAVWSSRTVISFKTVRLRSYQHLKKMAGDTSSLQAKVGLDSSLRPDAETATSTVCVKKRSNIPSCPRTKAKKRKSDDLTSLFFLGTT